MALITVVLALLPGFAWLFFYLQEDPHPEPRRLIALTFVAGAASAVLAFGVEIVLNTELISFGIPPLTPASLIILAFVEEFAKFAAAYLIVHRNRNFDEPIDAMIYMVIASLGFATVENIGAITGNQGLTAIVSSAFETASFRFIGATLLHALASGILGYYWAISVREFRAPKPLLQGLVIATGLHAFFNYLIIGYGNLMYSVVFVIIVGFFALNDFEKLKKKAV